MSWEELKARQQQEWVEYFKDSLERRQQIYDRQTDTLKHCHFSGPKGNEIIRCIFDEQRKAWLSQEKDDQDRLRYAHEYEREEFKQSIGLKFAPECHRER